MNTTLTGISAPIVASFPLDICRTTIARPNPRLPYGTRGLCRWLYPKHKRPAPVLKSHLMYILHNRGWRQAISIGDAEELARSILAAVDALRERAGERQ